MAHHVHCFNYWWVEHMPAIWWGFFKILFVICNFLCLKPWLSVEIYFGQLIPGRIKIDNLQCALWQSKELVDDHKHIIIHSDQLHGFFPIYSDSDRRSYFVAKNPWEYSILHGIACYWMVLHGIAWTLIDFDVFFYFVEI